MAGVYGEVDSRQDFLDLLSKVLAKVQRLASNAPTDGTLASVTSQLAAIQRWTLNARTPSDDERTSIDIGLLAAREMEGTGDPQADELAAQLQWINNYFEDWPSDDVAASARDDDFFESDDS